MVLGLGAVIDAFTAPGDPSSGVLAAEPDELPAAPASAGVGFAAKLASSFVLDDRVRAGSAAALGGSTEACCCLAGELERRNDVLALGGGGGIVVEPGGFAVLCDPVCGGPVAEPWGPAKTSDSPVGGIGVELGGTPS